MTGKAFSAAFRTELAELLRWRRDVRRFRSDPVDETVLARCLDGAVRVRDSERQFRDAG